jgi:uncharacterized membrane protein YkvI
MTKISEQKNVANNLMPSSFRKYLLPGFIFQSIVIGGGYGTGREIVEYFLRHGPVGGYLGILIATALWSVILAACFELARMGRHYDYRTFVAGLLGKGWIAFEIVYVVSLIVTVAVIGSATGELFFEVMGWPRIAGTGLMMFLVGALAFRGSVLIEKVFSFWSLTLYAVYVVLMVLVFVAFGDRVIQNASLSVAGSQWALGGFKYAAYNLGAVPAMLFSLRYLETRKDAILAGLLAGPIGIIPGILVFTAMLSQYPNVVSAVLPINTILDSLGRPLFQRVFQVILFGTFIETGTGMIHGFNERIAGVYQEYGREMPRFLRLSLAVGILFLAIYFADRFGLIKLISEGYGLLAWGYWLFFVLPVFTFGIWRVSRSRGV